MGWLASILCLIGLLLNARKVRASWFVWMVGNVLWMLHGARTHDPSIVVRNFVFLWVNYYGFFKWRPDAPALIQTAEDLAAVNADFAYPDTAIREASEQAFRKAANHAGCNYTHTPCPSCGNVYCRHAACLE